MGRWVVAWIWIRAVFVVWTGSLPAFCWLIFGFMSSLYSGCRIGVSGGSRVSGRALYGMGWELDGMLRCGMALSRLDTVTCENPMPQ